MANQIGIFFVVLNSLVIAALTLWPSLSKLMLVSNSLMSVQILLCGALALLMSYRVSRPEQLNQQQTWFWLCIAILTYSLLILNLTGEFQLNFLNYFQQLFYISLIGLLVTILTLAFLPTVTHSINGRLFFASALIFGGLAGFLKIIQQTIAGDISLLIASCMVLLLFSHIYQNNNFICRAKYDEHRSNLYLSNIQTRLLLGVAGTGFIIFFLQISLFQTFVILRDYLTANSMMALALIGIASGGLVGWLNASRAPKLLLVSCSLALPFCISILFSVIAQSHINLLLIFLCLLLPFACASCIIAVILSIAKSHTAYFINLLGSALGAITVCFALQTIQEEGTFLFLCAFSALTSLSFIATIDNYEYRYWLRCVAVITFFVFILAGVINANNDMMNFVKNKISKHYPHATVITSLSSLNNRYDVVKNSPNSHKLTTYRNGIDTTDITEYDSSSNIDPRLPILYSEPSTLIIGLTSESLIQRANQMSRDVTVVEPDKSIIELKSQTLAPILSKSKKTTFTAADARVFMLQNRNEYDLIALLSTHNTIDCTFGRMASPEKLYTYEAINSYLNRLSPKGILSINETVAKDRCEPIIWKMVYTMRQVLLDNGFKQAANHFYIFKWHNATVPQIQVIMKKTPFTAQELDALNQWQYQVNQQLVHNVLYLPNQLRRNEYNNILNGQVTENFLRKYNIVLSRDDQPFYFDTDPKHQSIRSVYFMILKLTLLLIPFVLLFIIRFSTEARLTLPLISTVAVAGLAFMLIQIVLLQRFQHFLESDLINFITVITSVLLFSGLGSLSSGKLKIAGVYNAVVGIIWLLAMHLWLLPQGMSLLSQTPQMLKVIFAIFTIAPLAFLMGIPFPYILRISKLHFSESAAAILFSIHAACSAIAIPLTLFIAVNYGYLRAFETGVVAYIVLGALILAIQKQMFQRLTAAFAMVVFMLLLILPVTNGQIKNNTITQVR